MGKVFTTIFATIIFPLQILFCFTASAGTNDIIVDRTYSPIFSVSDDLNTVVFGADADLTGNNPGNIAQFYAYNVNASKVTQLTNFDVSQIVDLQNMHVTHDGKSVVFAPDLLGISPSSNISTMWTGNLYDVDTNGENFRQLTNFPNTSTKQLFTVQFRISTDDSAVYYAADFVNGSLSLGTDIDQLSLTSLADNQLFTQQKYPYFAVASNQSSLVKWDPGAFTNYDLTASLNYPDNKKQLLTLAAEYGFCVSNDGKKVLFASPDTQVGDLTNTKAFSELYSINTDGSELMRITQAQDDPVFNKQGVTGPVISANNDKIAFQADTGIVSSSTTTGNRNDVYVYDISDNKITRVTNLNGSVSIDRIYISADGSTVAFFGVDEANITPSTTYASSVTLYSLYMVGSDGSNFRKVDTVDVKNSIFWYVYTIFLSPNGDRLMYAGFNNPSGIDGEGSYAVYEYCTDASIANGTCSVNGTVGTGSVPSGGENDTTNKSSSGGTLSGLFLLVLMIGVILRSVIVNFVPDF